MSELVALIDYGSGNLRSAEKAIAKAIRDGALDAAVVVTSDADVVRRAQRVVLPGVGAFADCMRGLRSVPGMAETLHDVVMRQGRPFLGICVGMQLMARVGREHGVHEGLGWLDGEVVRLAPADQSLKIPHMGWNILRAKQSHPVTAHLQAQPGQHAYFVHSFEFKAARDDDVIVDVDYGGAVVAAVARDNLIGTQFHPEKSQAVGLRLLENFVRWRP